MISYQSNNFNRQVGSNAAYNESWINLLLAAEAGKD